MIHHLLSLMIFTMTGTWLESGTIAKTRETGGIVAAKWSVEARSNGPILIGGGEQIIY